MLNKVILIGRLGKDPEIRYTAQGTQVANFSLATNEYSRDKEGNPVTKAEWHSLTAWERLAEQAEKYLKKGSLAYVEGKLKSRAWVDKEGVDRKVTEIVISYFRNLSPKEEPQAEQEAPKEEPQKKTAHLIEADDIPF